MSKSFLKIMMPVALAGAAMLLSTPSSFGKAEYTKKEKKACTVCHVATGKAELNDVGKCYASHDHSLTGCEVKK